MCKTFRFGVELVLNVSLASAPDESDALLSRDLKLPLVHVAVAWSRVTLQERKVNSSVPTITAEQSQMMSYLDPDTSRTPLSDSVQYSSH
jgi:hypothetical protein